MCEIKINGCLPAEFDVRDYRLNKEVSNYTSYPSEYVLTDMPKVKDKGLSDSCVAHAIAGILEFHDNLKHTLSTNFIYGLNKKLFNAKDSKMSLRNACKLAIYTGVPEYKYCPGNDSYEVAIEAAEKAYVDIQTRNNACEHRIKSYIHLYSNNDIKYAIMNYGPVLCSIKHCEEDTYVCGTLLDGYTPIGNTSAIIYGWTQKGFLCQESWGTHWGLCGSFIIPHFSNCIAEAYALVPFDKSEGAVIKPKRSELLDVCYSIINFIMNTFKTII